MYQALATNTEHFKKFYIAKESDPSTTQCMELLR
jgi:hypothetical protein